MTETAGDHEQVPDGVVVGDSVDGVEDDADRIAETPGEQPEHTLERHHAQQAFEVDDDQPAERDIQDRGKKRQAVGHERFENHPDHSKSPDHAEQGPAIVFAHRDQGERRIGRSDHQEDAGVVEDSEDVADSLVAKGVVERRDNVENTQDAGKDRRADNPVRVSGAGGCNHQNNKANDTEQGSHAVSQAVGQLFRFAVGDQVILGHHRSPPLCIILL